MKDLIIPVNSEALRRALVATVGQQQLALINETYKEIDSAMNFGYELSQTKEAELRKKMAEEYVEALQRAEARDDKEAFNQGYDAGYSDGKNDFVDEQAAYDDGYVAGVSDARLCPEAADREVARLCHDDYDNVDETDSGDVFWDLHSEWGDEYVEENVSDSGDTCTSN